MASMLNAEKKAIFVHIPKNAGRSIARTLRKDGGYRRLSYRSVDEDFDMGWRYGECQRVIDEVGGDVWDECFTFAFVRNPWDRLVSSWQFTRQSGGHELSFPEFVRALPPLDPATQDAEALGRAISVHWHAMPQSDHLRIDGTIAVDFIGHVETLDEDLRSISARIGWNADIPHVNASDRGDYRAYYTDELLAIVDERFGTDVRTLGYTF